MLSFVLKTPITVSLKGEGRREGVGCREEGGRGERGEERRGEERRGEERHTACRAVEVVSNKKRKYQQAQMVMGMVMEMLLGDGDS